MKAVCAATASAQKVPDRTTCPITEPKYPRSTEFDVRNATWSRNQFRTSLILFILFILSLLGLPQRALGDNWIFLGQNDDFAVYVDGGSAKEVSETASKVWTKVVAKSQQYKKNLLQFRQQQGLPVDGYDNFAYTLDSVEIECSMDEHRTLETSDYDSSDRKLSASFPISDWLHTSPGTPIAAIAKAICRQHAESGYWWWDLPEHQSRDEK